MLIISIVDDSLQVAFIIADGKFKAVLIFHAGIIYYLNNSGVIFVVSPFLTFIETTFSP